MNIAVSRTKRLARQAIITLGLEATSLLNHIKMLRPSSRAGFIFTLHHVRPFDDSAQFQPNRHLEITPDFLAQVIELLRAEGFDFIRMSDLPARLGQAQSKKPFAIFTLDDGYKNNRDYALPVFERYQVPATIYITPRFAERSATLWWVLLERLIAEQNELAFNFGQGIETNSIRSMEEKFALFNRICQLMAAGKEAAKVELLTSIAKSHGIDPLAITEKLTMSTDELAALSSHPLIDFGAHGQSHLAIASLPLEQASEEISQSVTWLEQLTGTKPTSFAFPYGSAKAAGERDFKLVQDLGINLAVTTRPGMIRTDHLADMSALPRVSLNGLYQKSRYAAALISGIPFRWGKH